MAFMRQGGRLRGDRLEGDALYRGGLRTVRRSSDDTHCAPCGSLYNRLKRHDCSKKVPCVSPHPGRSGISGGGNHDVWAMKGAAGLAQHEMEERP